jgi:hypothetical protein
VKFEGRSGEVPGKEGAAEAHRGGGVAVRRRNSLAWQRPPVDEVWNGGLRELAVVKGRASGNMIGQRGSPSGGAACRLRRRSVRRRPKVAAALRWLLVARGRSCSTGGGIIR